MNDYDKILSETIESVTDNIKTQFHKVCMYGYEEGKKASCDCKEDMEAEYNRGLNDAWEAARKLAISSKDGGLDTETIAEIFDGLTYYAVFKAVSASEAVAKIKECEQQKQDTIKVWDEVYSEMNDLRFIVTRIITSKHMDITVKRYEGICTDGACYDNLPEDIVKTGRTFPQIAEVLDEMRGESE